MSGGGQIFCAHPQYQKGGPWYDWAMFCWAKEGTKSKNRSREDSCVHYGDDDDMHDKFTYAPDAILGFLIDHSNPVGPYPEPDIINAIVVCCDSSYSKSTVFSTHWKVLYTDKAMCNPMTDFVSLDSIARHTLMIPENDDWNGFHEIW